MTTRAYTRKQRPWAAERGRVSGPSREIGGCPCHGRYRAHAPRRDGAQVSRLRALPANSGHMFRGWALVNQLLTTAQGLDIWQEPDASDPIRSPRWPGDGIAPDPVRRMDI